MDSQPTEIGVLEQSMDTLVEAALILGMYQRGADPGDIEHLMVKIVHVITRLKRISDLKYGEQKE